MPTVAITTLGCKINQFDSAAMAGTLQGAGYELVPFGEQADIYLINSCSVTARSDAESRRLIRRARRRNPAARIVVTGCYAQVAPTEVNALAEVDLVVGNLEKQSIAHLLADLTPRLPVVSDLSLYRVAEPLPLVRSSERTRAFLQVQTGCEAGCSYCIVPRARGVSRSVPAAELLAAVDESRRAGFQEVVLTGIHLGAYGHDLSPATSLLPLLRQIDAERLIPRLRLGSLEPLEVDEELITLLATSQIICPHLHIPLQSGSDPVLARMNRRYSAREYAAVVERLNKAVPGVTIGADVIVGFPGEGDDDFAATCRLVEDLPLAYLHVFPYSRRPGTPAADFTGQLQPSIIHDRAAILRRIGEEKWHKRRAEAVDTVQQLLLQENLPGGRVRGISRSYLEVEIEGDEMLLNQELRVKVTELTPSGLLLAEPLV
jgi:threonylcarbamoyladenosine tRNA methylthiotransferase MtaB